MCGREIAGGILCEKCDKPRKKSGSLSAEQPEGTPATSEPIQQSAPSASSSGSGFRSESGRYAAATMPRSEPASDPEQRDPFPKAPLLPFPVESASPAVTSVVHLLIASGVASLLIGPDRGIKFVSDEAKSLFDSASENATLAAVENAAAIRIGDLSLPTSAGVRIGLRNFIYTLVPLTGGASGAVLVFRPVDPMNESHASFVTYVRETVLAPLRGLRESFEAASQSRSDQFLSDAAAAVEQILTSLELAPQIEEPSHMARPVPTVTDVVRRVADRFRAYADLKGIRLDVDAQDLEERFVDHEQLADSLAILMENALHYVPGNGQVVIGVRWMEHKGKPLLLFFVMDNGAVVPEPMRQAIFEPSFVWSPSSPERTGRGLFKTREFAVARGGSVWVESKTGKACTFFLRIRPEGVR
jgi:signal transduction histidine kinase